MKEKLIKLLDEFYQYIRNYNAGVIGHKSPLDDAIEPTLDNFYTWLKWKD